MRFTRAAPAAATSSFTPPTSRAVAPLMGASSASDAFLTAFLSVVFADLFEAFFADLFGAFFAGVFFAVFFRFAMVRFVAQNHAR